MLAFGLTLALVDKFSSPMTKAADLVDKFRSTTAKTGETAKRLLPDVAGVLKSFETVRLNPTIDAANELADSLERLHESGTRMENFGKKAGVIGAGLLVMGRGMLAQEQQALQRFAARETASAYIQTIAPGTFGSPQEDVTRAVRAADEWSLRHKDSSTAYLEATYQLLSAGMDTRQALAGTESALLLATAARGDPAESANLIATAFNTLGDRRADPNKELRRIANVIGKTQAVFQLPNLGVLSQGLNMGFSTALANNESMEELAGTIGFLNNLGVQGSMAGTAYAATMRQMLRASKELRFELVQNAQGGVDLLGSLRNLKAMYGGQMNLPKVKSAFQRAFGDEGLKAVTLIVNKMDDYEAALRNVGDNIGTIEKNAAIIEDTFAAGESMRGNAADLALVQWAASYKTLWEWLANVKASTSEWFGKLLADSPIVAKVVGYTTAAVTGLVMVAGGAALAIGGVALAVGWYAKAIAVLTAHGLTGLVKVLKGLGTGVRWTGTILKWAVKGPFWLLWHGVLKLGAGLKALWVTHLPKAAAATWAWAGAAWKAAMLRLPVLWASLRQGILLAKGFTVALLMNPFTWVTAAVLGLALVIHKLVGAYKRLKNVTQAEAAAPLADPKEYAALDPEWQRRMREQGMSAGRKWGIGAWGWSDAEREFFIRESPKNFLHDWRLRWTENERRILDWREQHGWAPIPQSPHVKPVEEVDLSDLVRQWKAVSAEGDRLREKTGATNATINIEHLNLDGKDVDTQEKLLAMLMGPALETGL